MKTANYDIVSIDSDRVVIRDLGPWDTCPTVTNDAEGVVRRLVSEGVLGSRRLFYIDSDGREDEIIVQDGKFMGFG